MCARLFMALLTLFCTSPVWAEDGPNPDVVYFFDGQTPDNWQWVLSDPDNWWMAVPDSGGTSGGGKVTLANAESDAFPGAVKLNWRGSSNWGGVSIIGREVDLSAYEHTAELAIAVKVESKIPRNLTVKMTCDGENCEATVNVASHLRQMSRGEWMLLPIPLNCFSSKGLDLSKVTSPFSMGTESRLELQIAEISLVPMAEGSAGCVAQ